MKPEGENALPGDPSQVSGGDCGIPVDLGSTLIDAYEDAIGVATDIIEAVASKS